MKTAFFILVGFALLIGFTEYGSKWEKEWNRQFRVYQVNQVIDQARYLEEFQSFTIKGITRAGWGIPALFKVFPLKDQTTDELVLIIPKTRVLPKPTHQPATFKVQIYAQPILLGTDVLILKEVD